MQKMYFLAFVNSAIIIQLVYMDIPGLNSLEKYDQFS